MPLQNVPWATGNGSLNPVEGARMSLYAATKEARGVLTVGAMRVAALPVPGSAVRIHHGGCVTPNDYLKAQEYGAQAYVMREMSWTDFEIPATGSSGGATRYLIARIKDHQYAGNAPEDPKNGPYNEYALVSSIDNLSYPHVPLAKITQPANTGTITNSMITDIREVAIPRAWDKWLPRPVLNGDLSGYSHKLRMAKTGDGDGRGEQFPDAGRGGEFKVDCPDWASWMQVRFIWTGVRYAGKNAWGGYYLQWTDGKNWRSSQDFSWDQLEAGYPYVTEWTLNDNLYIPPVSRGKTLRFYPRAFRDVKSPESAVELTGRSGLSLEVRFLEIADAALES